MRSRGRFRGFIPSALALAATLLLGPGTAQAGTKYVSDGAVKNARGGWDLPKQGACPADATAKSRAECIARRFTAASSSACTALGAAGQYSWSTGACTDLVNNTQAACNAAKDRYWAANGTCAVVMEDDDRNALVCVKHGGTWVTSGTCTAAWVMPSRTDAAYGSKGLFVNDSATGSAGAGDQCLRCHNAATQYNGPRVRDVAETRKMGHKNMSRPVDSGFKPWGGPPFSCTGHSSSTNEEDCVASGGTWDPTIYPSDDAGNTFNWAANKINVGAKTYDLKWIYGDWLAPLPRAIYVGSDLNNMSYSCGRCHTTGWTSDAGTTPKANKHPESDFPGITWNGTGTTGQVKLGGGVAGDPNVMSSWDEWGITCSRCHSSAVDDSTAAPSFAAPAGMSMHHNNLTSPTNNSGVCTDVRFASAPSGSTLEDVCTQNGGAFQTACSVNPTPGVCTVAAATQTACAAVAGATWVANGGWCSNAFYKDSASCTANSYTWNGGWCKTADAKSACTGGTGDGAKTWRLNGSQASCQIAGASWTFSSCSVEGFCSKGTCSNSKYTNAIDCQLGGAFWSAIKSKTTCDNVGGTFAYATDVLTCDAAGGRWYGNNKYRGQLITRLCMDCHRQETSGWPNTNGACSDATKTTQGACVAAGATWTESGNGIGMLVGPYHSTVAFPSHPHSNQFLNSPHAKFTGKWADIGTSTFSTASDRKYNSSFMTWGESDGTGNGCTGCHNVHESIVTSEEPFESNCAQCHHVMSLAKLQHPGGEHTPLAEVEEKPMEACVTCHMPGGLHLFRINTDKAYSTFPMPQAMAGNVAPNTAPDGTFTNAVWVDLDAACGQCHGGGTARVVTTGTVAAASASLTVASPAGFAVGQKIRVAGAGAYVSPNVWADFDTYVKAIAGNVVTLAGTATHAVTNAVVTQNQTTDWASYMTKDQLSAAAKGIHEGTLSAFRATRGANELTVSVDAATSRCSGKAANCEAYSWSWGDGQKGDGRQASHTYAVPGTYTISLTVRGGGEAASARQTFTAQPIPGAPEVSGSCTPYYATASVTCSISVPQGGYKSVVLTFGDRATVEKANVPAGTLEITHTYADFDNFVVGARVENEIASASATLASLSRAEFVAQMPTISGRVLAADGRPVAFANVTVSLDGRAVASTMSREDGTYATGQLRHGTYTISVSKSGYTFPASFGPFTVGPSLGGQNLTAAQ